MYRWEKLGHFFSPVQVSEELTYAQVPFTHQFDGVIRFFYSTRGPQEADGNWVSHLRWVDYKIEDFPTGPAIRWSESEAFGPGEAGSFDETGVMGGSLVKVGGKQLLYYSGWNRPSNVPYGWEIGVARSLDDGTTFQRVQNHPVFRLNPDEMRLFASPIVTVHQGELIMFFLGGISWLQVGQKMESVYRLYRARSSNGQDWTREIAPLLEITSEFECQTSPTILKSGSSYTMFFSYRSGKDFRDGGPGSYRIGQAQSRDLLEWKRQSDPLDLLPDDTGWDSEMVAYPHCFEVNGEIYMAYCGNHFGKEGFGLARLVTRPDGTTVVM